jgi:hypothetical protein
MSKAGIYVGNEQRRHLTWYVKVCVPLLGSAVAWPRLYHARYTARGQEDGSGPDRLDGGTVVRE